MFFAERSQFVVANEGRRPKNEANTKPFRVGNEADSGEKP